MGKKGVKGEGERRGERMRGKGGVRIEGNGKVEGVVGVIERGSA